MNGQIINALVSSHSTSLACPIQYLSFRLSAFRYFKFSVNGQRGLMSLARNYDRTSPSVKIGTTSKSRRLAFSLCNLFKPIGGH